MPRHKHQFKPSGWGCHSSRGNMYMFLMIIVIAAHVLLLPIYLYLTWHHKYWAKRGVITARPLTVLGTYPGIVTRSRNLVEDVQRIYDKYKGKHRVVGVFMTRQPQLLVLDPQVAREVLVSNFQSFRDSITSGYIRHAKWDKYARRNPFWASGETWRTLRTDGQGGVSLHRLKQAYNIWDDGGSKLNDYIMQLTVLNENILETRDLCFRYTAHVMADFIWGIDVSTLTCPEKPNEMQKMANKWTSYAFYMLTIFAATIVAPFTRILLRLRFYPKETDDFFSKLTRDSINHRLSAGAVNRTDYLAYLLQLREQKEASHDDLVGHAMTIMLDGYDTTGTALLHALYYLAENLTVQQKLRNELQDNMQADKSLDFEQLCALPYLDQCVYEALRLSSLIPQYTKICTSATSIQLSEHKTVQVEKGISVMIPNYQFHHDKQYFPDPETYRPERFNNGAHQDLIKKGVLLPFSDGPRICMGQRLALLTLKSALSHILCEYQVIGTKKKACFGGDNGFGITLQGDVFLEFRRFAK